MQLERIIAHRGASAYAPENTLAAFDKAQQMGAKWVEFDVMLSQDGEAFVFHDDRLKRTTGRSGEIGLVSAEYLRSLEVGSWFSKAYRGEKIPSLEQILAWLQQSKMQANIEIKPFRKRSLETSAAVLAALNQYWPIEQELPLVSSFDYQALCHCRSLSPELPLALLMHDWDRDYRAKAEDLNCFSIHLNHRLLTKARIAELKEQGYQVSAYTVNSRRQALQYFAWGLDAIFTDYPDLLCEASVLA